MGNIVSHNQRQSSELEHQWTNANSFPKSPLPRLSPLKVLPDRSTHQKLRPTNNGDILHSGGTLSGRHHHYKFQDERNFDSDSPLEYHERSKSPTSRSYLPNERDPLHKHRKNIENEHRNHYNRHQHQAYKKQLKRSGSEPDIQAALFREYQEEENRRARARKKYKAPSPPLKDEEREEPDGGSNSPIRKQRLFKTRAEMRKKPTSPSDQKENNNTNAELLKFKFGERKSYESSEGVKMRECGRMKDAKLNNRLSLPEMKRSQSMPEFQQELKEVTERLRNSKLFERIQSNDTKEKLKTLDPTIVKKETVKEEIKELQQPAKMFYFGMDEPIEKSTVVDRFASNYQTNGYQQQSVPNSSGSDMSSEYEMDDLVNNGIALQLRPILPKKQLEIPRFSPAAAWRLLSSVESNTADSTVISEDGPVLFEDRIEKLSRPPPPPTAHLAPRSSHDKSGDSGISGDAGPAPFDEGTDNNLTANAGKLRGITWTPQQDLGDDSSIDENHNFGSKAKRFTSGPHVFSLSLPREQHLDSYFVDKTSLQQYTGLQRFKKSVTGVLGNLSNKRESEQTNPENSNNWFLSKSAPNSLNNGFNSIETTPQKSEELENFQSLVPLANTKQNSRRLMYLPELENACLSRSRVRSKSADRTVQAHMPVFSKSCENISMEVKSSSEPEDLQDPPKLESDNWRGRKPKKFTFQSTVRQIERKRLADKLSREAERKEQQRLRELEAMQKVEEEFQRKRAREKASIRQQLRLYSMDDSGWSSLPPNLEIPETTTSMPRPDPDGAVSSTDSSPSFLAKANRKKTYAFGQNGSFDSSDENIAKTPVTQVLSEYRQTQREYKEFRTNTRHHSDHFDVPRQTTVHPQVTCNMPKARGSPRATGSSNYRKNFAHGVKSNLSVGSSYSDDSHVHKNKMYFSPITRF